MVNYKYKPEHIDEFLKGLSKLNGLQEDNYLGLSQREKEEIVDKTFNFAHLTDEEYEVIRLRYGIMNFLGKKLSTEELSKGMKKGQIEIRKIEIAALSKLRSSKVREALGLEYKL